MPASLVNSGVKQEISADHLDLLWKSVSEEKEVLTSASSSFYDTVKERNGDWRKKRQGQDNTKPTDENYFTKSSWEKLKHEWICDRCVKH